MQKQQKPTALKIVGCQGLSYQIIECLLGIVGCSDIFSFKLVRWICAMTLLIIIEVL